MTNSGVSFFNRYKRLIWYYSFQAYEAILCKVFGRGELPFNVYNLFIVPDYKRLLGPHVDKRLSRYTKLEMTQLAWRFEAVEASWEFPMGCRTFHAAYANKSNFEIFPDNDGECICYDWLERSFITSIFFKNNFYILESNILGYKAGRCFSVWHPQAARYNGFINGMYILQEFPRGPLFPAEFVKDSRKAAVETVREFGVKFPKLVKENREWEEFLQVSPQNDRVMDYLATPEGQQRYLIPLKEELFPGIHIVLSYDALIDDIFPSEIIDENEDDEAMDVVVDETELDIRPSREFTIPVADEDNVFASNSVIWSNRGMQCPVFDTRYRLVDGQTAETLREQNAWKARTQVEYMAMRAIELKDALSVRRLSIYGNKEVLVNR